MRVDGDGGHVETYAVAYHMEAEESPIEDLLVGVRYQDDVVRVGNEWKISRRIVIRQWHRSKTAGLKVVLIPPLGGINTSRIQTVSVKSHM